MIEADDALSSSALASTDKPSGAVTRTQQVMRRTSDFKPMLAGVDPTSTVGSESGGLGA